jgi:hypothetical protein
MKLLDEAIDVARRYGPTLVAHLLLFVWLSLLVLDTAGLPDGRSTWARISGDVDSTAGAVGLSLEPWYAIAAFLVVYLTAFEWVRSLLLSLPILRVPYSWRRDPALLGRASRVLRKEPDYWEVSNALGRQVHRAEQRVRQDNQSHPLKHRMDRIAFLRTYYGTVLIALLATLVWALEGSPFAASERRVWLTAFLLAAIAVGLRWVLGRQEASLQTAIGDWALDEFERAEATSVEDPLRYERGRAMEQVAEEELSYRRHPAEILSRLLYRLPRRWTEPLRRRIAYPRRIAERDWTLLASGTMRYSDETFVLPAALQAQPFAARFAALLERRGTGLAVLAPELSGLAPGASRGGSSYSFASRRHGHEVFGVSLSALHRLEDDLAPPRLILETGNASGFIAKLGNHPIEKLVMSYYPGKKGEAWIPLFYDLLGPDCHLAPDDSQGKIVGGVHVWRSVDLDFGSSYLLALRTESGLQARLILQCFRVECSQRFVIAWGYLRTLQEETTRPEVPAWWKPASWRGLLKSPPADRGIAPLTVQPATVVTSGP